MSNRRSLFERPKSVPWSSLCLQAPVHRDQSIRFTTSCIWCSLFMRPIPAHLLWRVCAEPQIRAQPKVSMQGNRSDTLERSEGYKIGTLSFSARSFISTPRESQQGTMFPFEENDLLSSLFRHGKPICEHQDEMISHVNHKLSSSLPSTRYWLAPWDESTLYFTISAVPHFCHAP